MVTLFVETSFSCCVLSLITPHLPYFLLPTGLLSIHENVCNRTLFPSAHQYPSHTIVNGLEQHSIMVINISYTIEIKQGGDKKRMVGLN